MAARADRDFQEALMSSLCAELQISGPLADPVDMVSVIRRVGSEYEYLFVLNFSKDSREVDLNGDLRDVETGESVANCLVLEGLESRVLRRPIG